VWISIFGEAYNKNVRSFLKEDLFRFTIKKANLTYIISNRIDLFLSLKIFTINPPNVPTIKSNAKHQALDKV
jgi:hypothetical protein